MLHDDLDFQGPRDRCSNADTFVAKLEKLSGLTDSLRMKHLFVDGDRACCVYDLVTATPVGDSPVAEYLEVMAASRAFELTTTPAPGSRCFKDA